VISAPPRAPDPSDPLEHDELEALIEEARRRAQRRRRRHAAVAILVALVAVAVFAILGRSAGSHGAAPAVSARSNAAAAAAALKLAFISSTRYVGNRNVPNPPPLPPGTSELYVVNADGSDKRLLARTGGYSYGYEDVAWSRDGRTIAFKGESRVLVVNADGSGHRNMTRAWHNVLPNWSPDGRRIVFVRVQPGQLTDIYVMNADGSGVRRLTRDDRSGFPIWSPNGRKIAFMRFDVSRRPGRKPRYVWTSAVWVMNADGSGKRRLARGMPSAWSPDGRRIAFTRPAYIEPHEPGMYVVNADGTGQQRLNTVSFGSAVWSPDGQRIAFRRARPGTRGRVNDIYVMNADGRGELNVSQSPVRDETSPVWAPT
jgi:TolB protein